MSTSQENPQAIPPPTSRLPTSGEISANLQQSDDPLEFVRHNLRPTREATVVHDTGGAADSFKSVVDSILKDADHLTDLQPDPVVKALQTEIPQSQEAPPDDDTPLTEEETKDKEKSFKSLKRKNYELNKQLEAEKAAAATAAAELQDKIKKYEAGEIQPEVVQKKDEEIKRLSYYQHLHDVRISPEYQEKYLKPLEDLKIQANKLAEDYSVHPAILESALEIDNKRELNAFLRNHFDDVGTLEARDLLLKIKDKDREAQEAEAKPFETLELLKAEAQESRRMKESSRITSISNNSRGGWIDAMTEVSQEETYPELLIKNEEEHDKFSKPIVEAASKDYGEFIKFLAGYGVQDLPKDVAKILAKRFLLSQAAGVMAASRANHWERSERVVSEAQRTAPMIRPPVGSMGNTPLPQQPKPKSPTEAAEFLLRKVGME